MVETSYAGVVAVTVRTLDVRATISELEDGGLLITAAPVGEATNLVATTEWQDGPLQVLIQAVPS